MNEEILYDENLQDNTSEILANEDVFEENVSDTEHTDLSDSGDLSLSEEEVADDNSNRTFTQEEVEQIISALFEEQRSDASVSEEQAQVMSLRARENLYTLPYFISDSTEFGDTDIPLNPDETYTFSCDVSSDFSIAEGQNEIWLISVCNNGVRVKSIATTSVFQRNAGGTFTVSITGYDALRFRSIPKFIKGSTSNYLLYSESQIVEPEDPVEVAEQTMFEKPLADYSVSEGLLLCILLLILANFIHSIFKGSHWFGKL